MIARREDWTHWSANELSKARGEVSRLGARITRLLSEIEFEARRIGEGAVREGAINVDTSALQRLIAELELVRALLHDSVARVRDLSRASTIFQENDSSRRTMSASVDE